MFKKANDDDNRALIAAARQTRILWRKAPRNRPLGSAKVFQLRCVHFNTVTVLLPIILSFATGRKRAFTEFTCVAQDTAFLADRAYDGSEGSKKISADQLGSRAEARLEPSRGRLIFLPPSKVWVSWNRKYLPFFKGFFRRCLTAGPKSWPAQPDDRVT
jgi:hypothetical protein